MATPGSDIPPYSYVPPVGPDVRDLKVATRYMPIAGLDRAAGVERVRAFDAIDIGGGRFGMAAVALPPTSVSTGRAALDMSWATLTTSYTKADEALAALVINAGPPAVSSLQPNRVNLYIDWVPSGGGTILSLEVRTYDDPTEADLAKWAVATDGEPSGGVVTIYPLSFVTTSTRKLSIPFKAFDEYLLIVAKTNAGAGTLAIRALYGVTQG